jgi:P-type Cu2+ transporter
MLVPCLHCGEETSAENQFCCKGCAAAHALVAELGLGRFYAARGAMEAGVIKPDEQAEATDISRFILKGCDGEYSLHLLVQGLQCAACVWLIESTLQRQEGVTHARVNMTSKRMVLRWRGDAERGNALVHLVVRLGYRLVPYDAAQLTDAEERERKFLLRCLAVAGFASGNLMLLSISVWGDSGEMGVATRDLIYWVSVLIGLPAILYAGQPFFRSALNALKAGRTNMDVPISLGVLGASGLSLWQTMISGHDIYFESAAMLLFFLLAGRYLDRKARGRARGAAQDLLAMMAASATVLQDGRPRSLPIREV